MKGGFQRKRICLSNTWLTILSRTINFVTLAGAAALLVSVVAARSAQAQNFTVWHEFSGPPDGV